jgi:hypothetical protein
MTTTDAAIVGRNDDPSHDELRAARLNYAKKWRKLAVFRGAKAPFLDAWSRGF